MAHRCRPSGRRQRAVLRPVSRRARRRPGRERGAALVEFALICIPLFTLLFGIIEFGWAFFQLNDVRHGAREGVRMAAVADDPSPARGVPLTQGQRIAQATCERMDNSVGARITIEITDLDGDGVHDVGDEIDLTVSRSLRQVTGLFNPILAGKTLDESIGSRVERDPGTGIDGTVWTCA